MFNQISKMKPVIYCFLLLSVTLMETQGGNVFDENSEKTKAKEEVTNKENKVKELLNEVVEKYVKNSRNDVTPEQKNKFVTKGTEKYQDFNKKLETEGIKSLKTAIEKNKPLSAYECVIKVTVDGKEDFDEILNKYKKNLDEIESKRIKELDNVKLLSDLIKFGLEKAIADTKLAIDKALDIKGIDAQKAAGLKKCENAEAQADNLKKRVLNLKKMESLYEDAAKTMDEKFASALKSYTTKLQNCVK